MPETYEAVLDRVLALPEKDRARLLDALIASEGPEPAVRTDAEWAEVYERRAREVDEGRVRPIPWEEMRREIFAPARPGRYLP